MLLKILFQIRNCSKKYFCRPVSKNVESTSLLNKFFFEDDETEDIKALLLVSGFVNNKTELDCINE